jgi:hypothetical protein
MLIMYALAIDVHMHRKNQQPGGGGTGTVKDAVLMVTSAQEQYGNIGKWTAASLQREVMKGNAGMSLRALSRSRSTTSKRRIGKKREYGDLMQVIGEEMCYWMIETQPDYDKVSARSDKDEALHAIGGCFYNIGDFIHVLDPSEATERIALTSGSQNHWEAAVAEYLDVILAV